MKITNLKDTWGLIIELDAPEEFFTYDPDYWRKLAYEKKLIFFIESSNLPVGEEVNA